jgi:flagellar assembly protein FliH
MPDKKPHTNRIPFETITDLDRWTLPRMGQDGKVISSVKKDKRAEAKNERIEDVTEPVQHKPLTAEQLNEITEQAEKEGYEAGFEKGLNEGFQQGQQQGEQAGRDQAYQENTAHLQDQIARLQSVASALMEPLEQQDAALENIIMDIAVGLSKHILRTELKADVSAMYSVVQQAVQSLPMGATNIRVFLHPDDVTQVKELFVGREWQFLADGQLEHGGCRVESQESIVDFSVERRLRDYLNLVSDQSSVDESTLEPVVDYRKPAEVKPRAAEGRESVESSELPEDDSCPIDEEAKSVGDGELDDESR